MAIMIENSKDDEVYFAVTVPKVRAEHLFKCLQRPLCENCGREVDECDADPCTEQPVHTCNKGTRLFEVNVVEHVSYSIYVEALNEAQAERAVEYMSRHDWEGPAETREKYGVEIAQRDFDYWEMDRAQVEKLEPSDVIAASDWIDE